MARPPKIKSLDNEQLAKVEALAAVLSRKQIADYFGISKQAWLALEKRQPEILERYKIGKAKTINGIANSLLTKARKGDIRAMIFYLKTQAGWRETRDMEDFAEGDKGKILEIRVIDADEDPAN